MIVFALRSALHVPRTSRQRVRVPRSLALTEDTERRCVRGRVVQLSSGWTYCDSLAREGDTCLI